MDIAVAGGDFFGRQVFIEENNALNLPLPGESQAHFGGFVGGVEFAVGVLIVVEQVDNGGFIAVGALKPNAFDFAVIGDEYRVLAGFGLFALNDGE